MPHAPLLTRFQGIKEADDAGKICPEVVIPWAKTSWEGFEVET